MPDMTIKITKRKRAAPQDDTTGAGNQEKDGHDGNNIEEESRLAKRFRSSFTDTLTVLVGDEKVPFTIHTDTIRAKSTFFDAACQREWTEGREKMVKLPEVAPDTFELYAAWVYHGKIDHEALRVAAVPKATARQDLIEEKPRKFWSTSMMDLTRLHVAADFLGDAELMKRAVDGITEIIAANFTWIHRLEDIVSYIWGSTSSKSGLRKMVLDYVVCNGALKSMRDFLRELQPNVPSEFFADLALHSLGASRNPDTSRLDPLPARKHRYYDGYESDKEVATAQQAA
ncbi:hypothetical protein LTR10_008104 [Elasticomyces elasticus]|nr:hypothetical protein LTR10_008104 [Elasticomyces elasticus]KAK4971101.1 hypothetical protein LTR42_008080 [Elasticomyces elasticus]